MKSWSRLSAVTLLRLLIVSCYMMASVLLHAAPAAAAGATLYIDNSSNSTIDSTLEANIRINADNNNVNQLQFGLLYDTSKLEYVNTDSTASAFKNASASSTSGDVFVSANNSGNAINGNAEIVNIKFKVLSANGQTTLTFDGTRIYSANGTEVASFTSGTTYSLDKPAPVASVPGSAAGTPPVTTIPSAKARNQSAPAVIPAVTSTPAITVSTEPQVVLPVATSEASSTLSPSRVGSVFLKSSNRPTRPLRYYLQRAAATLIGFVVIVAVVGVKRLRRRLQTQRLNDNETPFALVEPPVEVRPDSALPPQPVPGSIVSWTDHDRKFEVIRPFAAQLQEEELTADDVQAMQNSPVSLPSIQEAESEKEQVVEAPAEDDLMYDINSPMMNTL